MKKIVFTLWLSGARFFERYAIPIFLGCILLYRVRIPYLSQPIQTWHDPALLVMYCIYALLLSLAIAHKYYCHTDEEYKRRSKEAIRR